MRNGSAKRTTKETQVSAYIEIDGTGKSDISTGIGFLDHMLEQLARHSLMDITLKAQGDLHIDPHHTTEDVGITLGLAFREALGDLRGINRYGRAIIPMDEALSECYVDICDRPYLVFHVKFTQERLGGLDTEMFREWYYAFAQHAGVTLHAINRYGTNNHHIAESGFKALAKALREAATMDERNQGRLASTKEHMGA